MRTIVAAVFLSSALAAPLAAQTADGQSSEGQSTEGQSTDLAATTPAADLDAQVAAAREIFIAGDHAAALAVLKPAAEAGHMRAQNIVASAYQYGLGLPVDAGLAVDFFERAAAQGYPPAMHNLGVLFETGMEGLAPDPVAARDWYGRAAALDYPPSLGGIGALLHDGTGGPADPAAALVFLRRGAEMGDPTSLEWLAYMTGEGEAGLTADLDESRRLYTIAAMLGRGYSQNRLGEMLERGEGGPRDLPAALDHYRQAAHAGYVYGAINAAWAITENPDEFPDQVEGLAWCFWALDHATPEEAADYAPSCNDLAEGFSETERREALKRAGTL